MFQFLATLEWPGAVALLGSVIAVVMGLLTLFLRYFDVRRNNNGGNLRSSLPTPNAEMLKVHERVSNLRDRIGTLEGEQKVLAAQIENLRKDVIAHDRRDVDDFKTINAKVDKLMEIIVEMLKDDH